jgi:tetratricopeptide (TPR) repeat protein
VFLLALALLPVPALVAMAMAARRRRAPRRVAGFHPPAGHASPDALRHAFRSAIEERLGFDAAAIARADDDVALALRRYGVTHETAAAVAQRLAELDRAAFGGASASAMSATGLAELYAAVDREALVRGRTPRINAVVPMALALVVLLAGAAAALQEDTAEQAFARGVEAWEAQRVDSAVLAFGDATRLAPRARDAWANYGEASWAGRDTAGAALGWQRALRLDPRARDVRERLALLGMTNDGWIAWVPPVNADHAAWLLGVTWTTGWLLLLLGVSRPSGAVRTSALVLLLVSGISAAVAVEGARRAEARGLAVVRGSESLKALPALAAEASAPVAGGEVARIVETGEVWSRVELDLGRSGWIASERLLRLTAR